jgi:diazepam-binding inhibitor (GABA receptor modulating acyl-CoA-binding protein)
MEWSIMSDLKTAFEAAVASTQDLTQRPSNATLLKMYALYKQASQGDVSTPKPGLSDLVGRAKWDAWNQLKGTDADTAMQNYIDLVDTLE